MPTNSLRMLKLLLLPRGSQHRRLMFGPVAGCIMSIDFSYESMLYFGIYEIELARFFRSLLRRGYGSFDIGGQNGYYALLLAKKTGGPVVSLECNHVAAEKMKTTFGLNPYRIRTIESTVSNVNDETHTTLDTIASQTFTPDFIKVDIEGAEVKALQGASRLLRDRKPSMIIEVHGDVIEAECITVLSAHGYAPIIVEQRKWLRENRPLDHNRWLVCEGRRR